jgi:DNA-binding GntR family transcriptional regulator
MPLFAWAYSHRDVTHYCCQYAWANKLEDLELSLPAGTSRYLDIAADLRTRILSGEWEPGANLPRMTDLSRRYGVNRDTLARAIAILEAEGLLWAVPRRGTVVRHGMSRPRRPRGNLVKRNAGTDEPG